MSAELDVSKFNAALAKLRAGIVSIVIGFNTNYAVFVHEILTSHHDQGQAKFLEAALSDARGRQLVEKAISLKMADVKTVDQIHQAIVAGVLDAAVTVLGNAQELCPIDTGALAASGTWAGDETGSGENPAGIVVHEKIKRKMANSREVKK